MEHEPAKATAERENETKPELINKKDIDDDTNKQPPEKDDTSPRLSSSSSASSSLSLEFGADENDLSSAPDDPWSMLSKSEPEPSTDGGNGYDPNRIPASIFSSGNKADGWSSLSNESLFSIHMGNTSFSRDLAILCEKSGELGRNDDWTNEHELMVSTGGLTAVSEETSPGGGVSRVDSFNNKGPHFATSMSGLSMPRLSNESGNSCASFAFPVLVGDGVKRGGSSRKGETMRTMTTEQRGTEEVRSGPATPQQGPGPGEQGGSWFSRLCCCCCCWPRCC